jgi:hypothetical protein
VADVPDTLVLGRHRDLTGTRRHGVWARRGVLAAIAAVALLALLNAFGQRPGTRTATAAAATLSLYAPSATRSGLLWSARFHIHARRELARAVLVLDPGWAEGMAVNTIEPSPLGEGSSNGRLTLQLGHIARGRSYLLFMQFQVNPTNIAWHRAAGVTLTDGSTPILRIDRSYVIYP